METVQSTLANGALVNGILRNGALADNEPASVAPASGALANDALANDALANAAPENPPANPPAESRSSRTEPPAPVPLVYDRRDFVFAFVLPVLGFLFIKLVGAVFIAAEHMGAGVAVYTLLFTAAALAWFRAGKSKIRLSAGFCLLTVLLAGGYFALYQNFFLQTFALLFLIGAAAYFVLVLGGRRTEDRLGAYVLFDLTAALFSLPFGNFSKLFAVQFDGLKKKKNSRSIILVIAGVFLALPVCIYAGALLQSADAAFEQFLQQFAGRFFDENLLVLLVQIILSLPVSMYLYGLCYSCVKKRGLPAVSGEEASQTMEKARLFPLPLIIGGISPLLLLYLMFFFSQSAYFLSAFGGLLPQGMIYSEYARRGFFELCRVSSLNLAVIALLLFLTKESGGRLVSRIYGGILSVFSMALIAISLSKMFLYIDIYGLTPLRVYTSWFMVFLLAVFICVIIRLLKPGFNMLRYLAVAGVVMFFVLCYADTDRIIASYNVEGYRSGKLEQLDVSLLGELGPGAAPYLIGIMADESMDTAYRDSARQILWDKLERGRRPGGDGRRDWRTVTLAGFRAEELLRENRELILGRL